MSKIYAGYWSTNSKFDLKDDKISPPKILNISGSDFYEIGDGEFSFKIIFNNSSQYFESIISMNNIIPQNNIDIINNRYRFLISYQNKFFLIGYHNQINPSSNYCFIGKEPISYPHNILSKGILEVDVNAAKLLIK